MIIAAGDDTVVFCEPQLAEAIREAIFTRTSRTTERQTVGLGQCVKKVSLAPFWGFDFCSKWSHCPSGLLQDWVLTRDFQKVLHRK